MPICICWKYSIIVIRLQGFFAFNLNYLNKTKSDQRANENENVDFDGYVTQKTHYKSKKYIKKIN